MLSLPYYRTTDTSNEAYTHIYIYIKFIDNIDKKQVQVIKLFERNIILFPFLFTFHFQVNLLFISVKDIFFFCFSSGIIKGDEIMVINGAIVSDLDMMYLESVLQEEVGLCMMMRSSRTEPPDLTGIMRVTDDIIESLVCPPPPSDPPVISEEMISGLIVPAPGWSKQCPFMVIILVSL